MRDDSRMFRYGEDAAPRAWVGFTHVSYSTLHACVAGAIVLIAVMVRLCMWNGRRLEAEAARALKD